NKRLSVLVTIVFVISSITGNGLIAFSADDYAVQGDTYIPATQYYASPSPVSSSSPASSALPTSSPMPASSPVSAGVTTTVQQSYAANTEATTSVLKMAEADQPLSSAESETSEILDVIPPPADQIPVEQTSAYHELQLDVIGVEQTYVNQLTELYQKWMSDAEGINEKEINLAINYLKDAMSAIAAGPTSKPPTPTPSPTPSSSAQMTGISTTSVSPSPGPSPSSSPAIQPAPRTSVFAPILEQPFFNNFIGGIIDDGIASGIGNVTGSINALEQKKSLLQNEMAALGTSSNDEANKRIIQAHIAYVNTGIGILKQIQMMSETVAQFAAAVDAAKVSYNQKIASLDKDFENKLEQLNQKYPMRQWGEPLIVVGTYRDMIAPDCTEEKIARNQSCYKTWHESETPTAIIRQDSRAELIPYQKELAILNADNAKAKAKAASAYYQAVIDYLEVLRNVKVAALDVSGIKNAYIGLLTTIESERYVLATQGKNLYAACVPMSASPSTDCADPHVGSSGGNFRDEVYEKVMSVLLGMPGKVHAEVDKIFKYAVKQEEKVIAAQKAEALAYAQWKRNTDIQDIYEGARYEAYQVLKTYASEELKKNLERCGTSNSTCRQLAYNMWTNWADCMYKNWENRDRQTWDSRLGYDPDVLFYYPGGGSYFAETVNVDVTQTVLRQVWNPNLRKYVDVYENVTRPEHFTISYPLPRHHTWICQMGYYVRRMAESMKRYNDFRAGITAKVAKLQKAYLQVDNSLEILRNGELVPQGSAQLEEYFAMKDLAAISRSWTDGWIANFLQNWESILAKGKERLISARTASREQVWQDFGTT
ncbi:MAG: hypothetical protein JW847_08755, partial [Candidatus Omnitrophica bacterium]|nr:hypothetical protein [Candidatus Omnitrophota bacterium]